MPDRPAVPAPGADPVYEPRCPALNPRSTGADRCQRPNGHTGDHVSPCHSGGLVIYPSKWTDDEEARDA